MANLGRTDAVTAASLQAEANDLGLQHRMVLRGLANLDRLTDPAQARRFGPAVASMRASATRVLALSGATADQRADAARFLDALSR